MRDMGTFHQEVVVAQNGLAALMGTTVDNHVLTDGIVIADYYLTLLTCKVEILWRAAITAAWNTLLLLPMR
ncbi:hypothetical protein OBE_07878, partial [human gut metagenome]